MRLLLTVLLALILSFFCARTQAQVVSREHGLQATLQESVTAFENADYLHAEKGFRYLAQTYADEPAYQQLEQKLLPLWAHACRMNGDSARAAELYERFLDRYPGDATQAPYVLFGLAQASQALGENERATDAYRRYREQFPERPEALISVLREADLAFASGEPERGITTLLAFSDSPRVPPTLRTQARLRAIQAAQTYGHDSQAADILLNTHWAISTMPELAMLAFASLRTGDYLAAQQRYTEAVLAYRNVPPHRQLIQLQRERLAQLERIRDERTKANPEGIQNAAFWEEYFGTVIERVRSELDKLVVMDNYTPTWQLRLGEALLRAHRSREGGLMFGEIAKDQSLESTLRSQAHYRWILCAQARENWPLALNRASAFMKAYPDNPLAPSALFLIATAFQQTGEYEPAISTLDKLIAKYPQHPQLPRWLFGRGYTHALAQQYAAAREDFTTIVAYNPDETLAPRARLWVGLSWFFEYNYPPALKAFNELLTDASGTALEPEVAYRRAATLYSMRDYKQAAQALKSFISTYPHDTNIPAAHVLLGDTFMGLGELDQAAEQFSTITPADNGLYPYAIFQTGKILRVSKKHDNLIKHFTQYAHEAEKQPRPRLAEALYWIGWAHSQKGDPAAGLPQFMRALKRTGNDPQSGDITPLLQALESLYTRAKSDSSTLKLPDDTATRKLLDADSFADWLHLEYNRAAQSKEQTRAARLALFLAKMYQQQGLDNRADALLFDSMSQTALDQLDANALCTFGQLLAANNFPSAREYFTYQLDKFPRNPRNAEALYALAKLAAADGDNKQATRWLRRLEAEAPFASVAPEAALLHAKLLLTSDDMEKAKSVLKNQLHSPVGRGRAHANALLLLAQIATAEESPTQAIAYDQRVYTLYRAYPDLLARAYWHSAQAFEAIGDEPAALRTLVEMTNDPRLQNSPEFTAAQQRLHELTTRQMQASAASDATVHTDTTP